MLARVRSATLRGIDALVVDVEVDVSPGLPQTTTVGLPATAARGAALRGMIAPATNAAEGALAGGPPVFGVRTLAEAVAMLRGDTAPAPAAVDTKTLLAAALPSGDDFADVRGQQAAKRAL